MEAYSNMIKMVSNTIIHTGIWLVALAVVFAVLNKCFPLNRNIRWWRKKSLMADMGYWFIMPLFSKFIKIAFISVGAVYLLGLEGESLQRFYAEGHGPLAELPLYAQMILYLVIADIPLYWIHRTYHQGALWRYHAVHHAPKDLDWISTMRFHPLNIWFYSVLVDAVMLLIGFSPLALATLAPFNIAFSAFVHTNANITLGPLKYVIATPIFHRWHHTSVEEGGCKNFAPTFPILDILFGTFYMPKGKLPESYGIDDENFPEGFWAQMLYPLRQTKAEPAIETIGNGSSAENGAPGQTASKRV